MRGGDWDGLTCSYNLCAQTFEIPMVEKWAASLHRQVRERTNACQRLSVTINVLFLINLQKFQTNLFHFVIMGYCVYNFEVKDEFNLFGNKAVTDDIVEKVGRCEYFPDALYLYTNRIF